MTNIVYLSDTHTEYMRDYQETLRPFVSKLKSDDILIIAGDFLSIGMDRRNDNYEILDFITEIPRYTIYVAGNHEYYKTSIEQGNNYFKSYENENSKFKFLNNETFEVDHIKIYGGTMWSNVGDGYVSKKIQSGINDFRLIDNFKVSDMNEINSEFMKFISNVKIDQNSIVVTHFLPNEQLIQPMFKGDMYNAYFCNMKCAEHNINPKFWIYGHNHDTFNELNIENTIYVTNQYGYYNSNNFGHVEYKCFEM